MNTLCGSNVTYLNLSGVRKLSRLKSSSRLFCRGVPVSSSLCFRGYLFSARKNYRERGGEEERHQKAKERVNNCISCKVVPQGF